MVVESTERLSAHLVRVHLGGPDFDAFVDEADPQRLAATDKYVKVLLAPPELGLKPPYDMAALRESRTPDQLPAQRTYTVRSIDRDRRTIALDFVVHGTEGVAGPWAENARPGDLLALSGPGGAYRPTHEPGTTFVQLGDDSAIPAISAALEAMPGDAFGSVVLEVDNAADELDLVHPTGIDLQWVHRASATHGSALIDAVRAMRRPDDPIEVFAHGERAAMQAVRTVLQDEWGLDRQALSLSAYWALGRAEDRFQAEKREPAGKIFTDG